MNRINRRDVLLGLGAAATAAVAPAVVQAVPAIAEPDRLLFKPERIFERQFLTGMRVVGIDIQNFGIGRDLRAMSSARISLANDTGTTGEFTTYNEDIISEMQRAAMGDRTFTIEMERDMGHDCESVVALAAEDGGDVDFGDDEEPMI